MGPIDDARDLQLQNTQGQYTGVASPHVPGPNYHGYTAPPNWSNPTVGSTNLMVHPDTLTQAATNVGNAANQLQAALDTWVQQAGPVSTNQAAIGTWDTALQLHSAVVKSHTSFQQFVTDLTQTHTDVQSRLNTSADQYTSGEAANVTAIQNAAKNPSATIINANGTTQHVDPTYGTKLTPLQYAQIQHASEMGGPTENWTKTQPITEDAPFKNSKEPVNSSKLQDLLAPTDPDGIHQAGQAYNALSDALTTTAGQLVSNANTLAENWSGANAVTAIGQLQQMHQTASDLQANAYSAGVALTWYGQTLKTFKQNVPRPAAVPASTQQPWKDAQVSANQSVADQAAQQHMDALNTHIGTAYNAMPPVLNQNLPKPSAPTPQPPGPGPTGGPGSGSGYSLPAVSPVGGAGSASVPAVASAGPSATVPSSVTGPQLSGTPTTPTTPVTTPTPPVTTPPVTTPAPVPTTLPMTYQQTDPTTGGSSTDDLNDMDLGGSSTPTTNDSSASSSDPANAADDGTTLAEEGGASAAESEAGMPGMGMGGMGGAGGSGSGAGRTRQSWANEDGDIWDPEDEAAFAGGPGMTDGMINEDSLPGLGTGAGYGDGAGYGSGYGPGAADGEAGAAGMAGEGAEAGEGYPMMAGAGAGSNREENGRQRQSWMQEDRDIWDPAEDEAPPIIG